ncbi:iron-sulfur cluster biosynthesis family protein [Paenibacillus whitsoniae]|nr:iron-sulfur cluster biosynthesis family protein [Paenibacillus whitsoniae]
MNITFTESAVARLTPSLKEPGTFLRLVFDTEGCGCSVNGVPTLWLVSETAAGDLSAATNFVPVYYKAKDEIFFEEHMKLDFNEATKSYILKSNNQIYNATMSLVDRRAAAHRP